ncbi:hypothetical protein J4Q44_G00027820 [Coregonus suidteri]|uniref:Aminoglycoside phosphotransferase domain-containing protein n=1 Tax=Coregonus suidteri TaxID=861788 RepID=A0AAN8MK93_9TELE
MYGVLIPSPVKVATVFEQQNSVPLGTLGKAIRTGGEVNAWKRFMRGELGVEEFVEAFGRQCSEIVSAGCPVPIGSFLSDLTSGPMTRTLPVLMEAILCARSRGLKTAVLSNNFLQLNGDPFLPLDHSLFDVIVESCREGLNKPDPRIYHLCLNRLGVSAHEAVFLDDLEFNIKAAAQLGMHAIKIVESCREGLNKPDPRIYHLCLNRLGVSAHEAVFLDDLEFNIKAAAQLGMHAIKVGDLAVAVKELEGVLGIPLSGFVTGPGSGATKLPMDQLTQYLRKALHLSDKDPVPVQQLSPSQSNSLYHLTTGGRHLLLRKQQKGSQAMETEYRLLKALNGSGIPVPEIIGLCEDPSVLGAPFLLMEVCLGRMFSDPSLPGLTPGDRRALYQAMKHTLCQIHCLDTRAVGLEDYGEPDYMGLQVEWWTQQYRDSETPPIPDMERLIQWLPLHLPKHQRSTLIHGSFRLENLVFHPEKPEVVAVLDWGRSIRVTPYQT